METMIFDDISTIQIPIKLGNEWYVLCEASEDTVTQFSSAGVAGIELDLTKIDTTNAKTIKESMDKGIKSFDPTKIKGTKNILVQGCLKHCTYDVSNQKIEEVKDNVSMTFVTSLPRKVLNQLFTKAKEISELDKVGTENPFQQSGQ